MRNLLSVRNISLLVLTGMLVNGCGYRPSAKFSRDFLGEKISTSVVISAQDPQNTVIIKDAVDRAIIEVFQASLVSESTSDTHLILNMGAPRYSPIVYDKNGFVVGYRMSATLNIISRHKGVSKNYVASGQHDFIVAPNAIVTDQVRFEAISLSASRAIKSFVAQASAKGARAETK